MSTFSLALSFGAAKERAIQQNKNRKVHCQRFTERRVYKKDVVGGTTTEILYLHDGMNAIIERNKTGTPTEYIYGPTGIIAIKTTTSMFYVLKDHLGSTRVMINTTDQPYALTTYDYSAFGTILSTPSSSAYLYTGQEWDQTSGLHNFKARMYDSDLAMFYGGDPAGELSTPFSFVGNNPVTRRDPSGKFIQLAAIAYYAYKAYQVYSIARAVYGIYQATKYGGVGGFLQGITAAGISYGIGSVAGGFAGGAGAPTLASSIRGGIASSLASGTLGAHASGGRVGLGWNTVLDAGIGATGGALAYGSAYYQSSQAAKVAGYDPKAPAPYQQETIDEVTTKSEELSEMRSRSGNAEARIVDAQNLADFRSKTLEGHKYGADAHGNLINYEENSAPLAATGTIRGSDSPIGSSISYRSSILVGRGAFDSYSKLFLVLGHEYTHAIQNYSGLTASWILKKTPNWGNLAEQQAYNWSIDAARRNGWTWHLEWLNKQLNSYR